MGVRVFLIVVVGTKSDTLGTAVGFIILLLERVLRFAFATLLHLISVSFLLFKTGFFFVKELLMTSSFEHVLETATISKLEVV